MWNALSPHVRAQTDSESFKQLAASMVPVSSRDSAFSLSTEGFFNQILPWHFHKKNYLYFFIYIFLLLLFKNIFWTPTLDFKGTYNGTSDILIWHRCPMGSHQNVSKGTLSSTVLEPMSMRESPSQTSTCSIWSLRCSRKRRPSPGFRKAGSIWYFTWQHTTQS